jgi:hypothetical protein
MRRTWVEKLDVTLQRLNTEGTCAATVVDCLILTDSTSWSDVETLIEDQGGIVHHRIGTVPGLTAALPVSALGAVASSEHVLQVEADLGYSIF